MTWPESYFQPYHLLPPHTLPLLQSNKITCIVHIGIRLILNTCHTKVLGIDLIFNTGEKMQPNKCLLGSQILGLFVKCCGYPSDICTYSAYDNTFVWQHTLAILLGLLVLPPAWSLSVHNFTLCQSIKTQLFSTLWDCISFRHNHFLLWIHRVHLLPCLLHYNM